MVWHLNNFFYYVSYLYSLQKWLKIQNDKNKKMSELRDSHVRDFFPVETYKNAYTQIRHFIYLFINKIRSYYIN